MGRALAVRPIPPPASDATTFLTTLYITPYPYSFSYYSCANVCYEYGVFGPKNSDNPNWCRSKMRIDLPIHKMHRSTGLVETSKDKDNIVSPLAHCFHGGGLTKAYKDFLVWRLALGKLDKEEAKKAKKAKKAEKAKKAKGDDK